MRKVPLLKGSLFHIEGRRGDVISCQGGVCWITQEGHPQDYFLKAGEELAIDHAGLVVVQGITDGAVCLKTSPCLLNLTWVRGRFLDGGAG